MNSAEELLGLMADSANITDSPDLGPPPVAHFEQGDPIKFDTPQKESSSQADSATVGEVPPKLPANLETRKKRRESSHLRNSDITRMNSNPAKIPPSKEAANPSQPLRSGAKRKFSVREEGGTPEPVEAREENEVQSSQKSAELGRSGPENAKPIHKSTAKSISSKTSLGSSTGMYHAKDKPLDASLISATSNRRALGPSRPPRSHPLLASN